MKMLKKLLVSTLVLLSFTVVQAGFTKQLSDLQIKQKFIQESIANYHGNCPCPYNTARNGSTCGGRSAYSRPGGEDPICYPKDVTPQMVKEYRQSHK